MILHPKNEREKEEEHDCMGGLEEIEELSQVAETQLQNPDLILVTDALPLLIMVS